MSVLKTPPADESYVDLANPYGIQEAEKLVEYHPRATPESSPEPTERSVSPPDKNNGESAKARRKALPSKGDAYLLRTAFPNAPEVTRQAEYHLPNPESEDELMDDVEDVADMDERMAKEMEEKECAERERRLQNEAAPVAVVEAPCDVNMPDATAICNEEPENLSPKAQPAELVTRDVQQLAADALKMHLASPSPQGPVEDAMKPPEPHISQRTERKLSSGLGISIKSERVHTSFLPMTPLEPPSALYDPFGFHTPFEKHRGSVGSPGERLAALSPGALGGPASPQDFRLPSAREILQIADKTNEANRQRSQSLMTAPSPVSTSSYRPSSFSGSVTSPNFSTSPKSSLALSPPSGLVQTRRESITLQTPFATANDSCTTTEAASPANLLPTPQSETHRPSIDESVRTLPVVHPDMERALSISALSVNGGPGTFKCEFPGCTAAPFQTSYLLNSHANVHSTNRPHYCPVPGCPRAEGGKGFKRKNEMIRHGLVHDSPGYICPYCPDREHKYPRPDNLQRHVRVHHPDKNREDSMLRDVLAQRPDLGTIRGRRRRMNGP